jgi:predicted dinucleotide-binding enzyme
VRWRKEHETRDHRLRTDGQRLRNRLRHADEPRGCGARPGGSAAELVRELGITRADDKALLSADVVFVAVPPAALSEVAADLKDCTGVVVSIIVPGAGGMTLAQQGASAAEQLAELRPKASVVTAFTQFLPC